MTTLKLTTIGTSTGVVTPKDMLARLNVGKGDVLHAVETPDGGYHLTPYDPGFADRMGKAEEMWSRRAGRGPAVLRARAAPEPRRL